MRVFVKSRLIRPRFLIKRSVRGCYAHWSHSHYLSIRPNYMFHPLKFYNHE